MPATSSDTISHDAERIYRTIFAADPPAVIIERFLEPSLHLTAKAPVWEQQQYRHAMEKIRDLEALEIAGRFSGTLPLLSKQFRLMTYLAETVPSNLQYFVNGRDGLLKGWTTIIMGGIRTAYKLMIGYVLLKGLPRA